MNSLHEYAAPKFTTNEVEKMDTGEYGGITGTTSPKSFYNVLYTLCLLVPEHLRLQRGKSVFMDIGSGEGRPCFYSALLPLKGVVGFEIDRTLVWQSYIKRDLILRTGVHFNSPVYMDTMNVNHVHCVTLVTHIYSFIGYAAMADDIARFMLYTKGLLVAVVVVVHEQHLRENGLYDPYDIDVIKITGMKMQGGTSYTAYVIPVTPERKKRINFMLKTVFNDINVKMVIREPEEFTMDRIRSGLENPNYVENIVARLHFDFTSNNNNNKTRLQLKRSYKEISNQEIIEID